MGDFDGFEEPDIFHPEMGAFARVRLGPLKEEAIPGTRTMMKSTRDKALEDVYRELMHYYQPELSNISANDLYVYLEEIPRIEFYSPLGLVMASLFRAKNRPLTEIRTFPTDIQSPISQYDLLRYVRFLDTIKK